MKRYPTREEVMAADPRDDENELPTEYVRLVRWRLHQLVKAGVPYDDAVTIANDREQDYYVVIGMISHGCDPQLAAEIAR